MSLAVLPVEVVPIAYASIKRSYTSNIPNDPMYGLFTYFEATWMERYPPASWNVFNLKTRTNNGAEGYHNRLISRAHKGN